MTEQVVQTRNFKMHPDLLFSVIHAQAGTPEKALLEAVMNAVDAGATKCEITLSEKGYRILDDGKGFPSQDEINQFFETFGTPHKEGDAPYGRFRMGRGQLFAFSTTRWRTGEFEMLVDIKKDGLNYKLKTGLENVVGCTIDGNWYKELTTQELFIIGKELEKLTKYMQIPVTLNGKKISVEVNDEKWDYKEDQFFVRVSKSATTLSVYNMGALVAHYPSSRFGVGGVVVTTVALKVNFARNDVLVSECPLWKKIAKKLKEIMGIETSKRTVLTEAEREALTNDLVTLETPLYDVYSKSILTDISGKKFSIKSLLSQKKIAISTGNYRLKKIEERIHDHKAAFVVSQESCAAFLCKTGEQLLAKIQALATVSNNHYTAARDKETRFSKEWYEQNDKIIQISEYSKPTVVAIESLISSYKDNSDVLENKDLNKRQKLFLASINKINQEIARFVYYVLHPNDYTGAKSYARTLCLGKSDVANAWTDGKSYICIEERQITRHPMHLIHLLVHEYCHTSVTNETHDHGSEFYEAYHNVLSRYSSYLFNMCVEYMRVANKKMLEEGIKPKKDFDTYTAVVDTHSSLTETTPEVVINESN